MIFLAGGPPHLDMFDLKPDAPTGIRGEYTSIPTNVPGLDICEYMPRLARMMDKFTVIRSLVGAADNHSAGQCMTGYLDKVSKVQGGRPSLGAVVSRLQGPVHADIPPFVGLSPRMDHGPWGNPGDPGYLGLPHAPFTPFRAETAPETRDKKYPVGDAGLSLDERVLIPERLSGRRSLLGRLDTLAAHLTTTRRSRGWTALPSGPSRFSARPDLRGSRPVPGRPSAARAVWRRRHAERGRRTSLLHGPFPHGPPPGRGRVRGW